MASVYQLLTTVAMAIMVIATTSDAATIMNGETSLFEIDIFTSDCQDCGMPSFLGELSVKVCGKGAAPNECCVAPNIHNSQTNWQEGKLDIFTGVELGECFRFNMGHISSADDVTITLYHALTDGGKFDYAQVYLSDNSIYRCHFNRFLDGADYEVGTNCQKMN